MHLKDAISAVLAGLDVTGAPGFEARVDIACRMVGLEPTIDRPPSPEEIASAWMGFLDNEVGGDRRETLEHVCVIGALHLLTNPASRALERAFSNRRMRLERSRTEMAMRAGSRLFMMGRRFKLGHSEANEAGKFLRGAIRCFDEAVGFADVLSPQTRVRTFGMRGVAALLLARGEPQLEGWASAMKDLERSHREGDNSAQNRVYRRECYIKLCNIEYDQSAINKLDELIEAETIKDRQYYADVAHYHQVRSKNAEYGSADSIDHLQKGIVACDDGLKTPRELSTPDEVFLSLRGFFRFLLSPLTPDQPDQATALLDRAIDDLRAAAQHGLGGGALSQALIRRSNILKHSDLDRARADLTEADQKLSLAKEDLVARLKQNIQGALLEIRLRQDHQPEDVEEILACCTELLDMAEEGSRHIHAVMRSLSFCWKVQEGEPGNALIEASDRAIGTAVLQAERDDRSEKSHSGLLLAAAGGLSRYHDQGHASLRTYELYRLAVQRIENPTSTILGRAGEAALRFGKLRIKGGDPEAADGYLKDAATWLQRALETAPSEDAATSTFRYDVCHSKLGEACLRMRPDGTGKAVASAIKHFEASIALGNTAHEILGLLGDAYYRRGYNGRNRSDLNRALALKVEAQAAGHSARESCSIIARIHYRLFEMDGGIESLVSAMVAAHQAHVQSDQWPWPFFQMAEFSRAPSGKRQEAVDRLPDDIRLADHIEATRRGDRSALLEQAVRLAIDGTEFKRDTIGGKAGVFVLDDPHRLLSTTMVLKPTTADDAAKEMETVAGFGRYLKSVAGPFGLPTPIAVIPGKKKGVVYAMERARAVGLNDIICGPDVRGYQGHKQVGQVLDFLAAYHLWSGIRVGSTGATANIVDDFMVNLKKAGVKTAREACRAAFRALLPAGLPCARKKDAHPENWLVGTDGRLVMIDLEATSIRPGLCDVAQLLDDYPVFEPTVAGWAQRMALAEHYWTATTAASPQRPIMEQAYSALVIARCVFGLGYCAREARKDRSSTALKALALRQAHYRALLEFLATQSSFPAARELAALVLEAPGTDAAMDPESLANVKSLADSG